MWEAAWKSRWSAAAHQKLKKNKKIILYKTLKQCAFLCAVILNTYLKTTKIIKFKFYRINRYSIAHIFILKIFVCLRLVYVLRACGIYETQVWRYDCRAANPLSTTYPSSTQNTRVEPQLLAVEWTYFTKLFGVVELKLHPKFKCTYLPKYAELLNYIPFVLVCVDTLNLRKALFVLRFKQPHFKMSLELYTWNNSLGCTFFVLFIKYMISSIHM